MWDEFPSSYGGVGVWGFFWTAVETLKAQSHLVSP